MSKLGKFGDGYLIKGKYLPITAKMAYLWHNDMLNVVVERDGGDFLLDLKPIIKREIEEIVRLERERYVGIRTNKHCRPHRQAKNDAERLLALD